MAEGDGATERIDLARVETEVVDNRKCLRSKSFVQFNPAEIVYLQSGAGESKRDGFLRTDALIWAAHL
jgi:hypothetical protein